MKMKKKRLLKVIFVFIVIIFAFYIIVIFSKKQVTIRDIKAPNNSEYKQHGNYKHIFDIKYNCYIKKNVNEFKECTINYAFDIINKTDHPVNVGISMHIPQVLKDNRIFVSEESRTALFLEEDMPVSVGKTVEMHYFSLAKNYDSLQEREKNIFDEFKDTLYLELYIDGYIFYVKASPKGYDVISEEEFIKKAEPFFNGRLKDELKKVYRLKYKEN